MVESFPLRFLLGVLAGWVNRHQLDVIEYLREENRVLKKHIGKTTPATDRCAATPVGSQRVPTWATGATGLGDDRHA
jgi:hypothetical protein